MPSAAPIPQAAQMIEVNRMNAQVLDARDTKRHLEPHLRQLQTLQVSDGRVTGDEQLSDRVDRASRSATGPSRIMLVTAANRHAYERDDASLIGSGSDGFRGVQFRPARLAKRQTAA